MRPVPLTVAATTATLILVLAGAPVSAIADSDAGIPARTSVSASLVSTGGDGSAPLACRDKVAEKEAAQAAKADRKAAWAEARAARAHSKGGADGREHRVAPGKPVKPGKPAHAVAPGKDKASGRNGKAHSAHGEHKRPKPCVTERQTG